MINPRQELGLSYDGPVVGMFLEQVGVSPHSVALHDDLGQSTYEELAQAALAIAGHLSSAGVRQREFVAVWGDRSSWLVAALIGVLQTGAAFCVLDPSHPERGSFTN